MSKTLVTFPKIFNVSSFDSTYTEKSRPIFLRDFRKVVEDNIYLDFKSSAPKTGMVCTGFVATLSATAATTSDTATLVMQGCADPFNNQTELSADITAAGTTLSLDTRTGVPQYEYGLLSRADMTATEFVRVTDAAETGAGDKTIVRGQLGTTAATFSTDDHFLWGLGWHNLATNDGTTTTVTTGAVDVSSAAASVPITSELTSAELDLTLIAVPVIRLTLATNGTIDAAVDLTLVFED